MAVAMGDVPPAPVAFDIDFEPGEALSLPTSVKIPAKFAARLNRRKKAYTAEQLEEKLQRAEKRRKEQEMARLDRIHERQEHCQTMALKMALLMEQDAKRHRVPGKENIPAMSSRQAAAMIKSVATDFKKIGIDLVQGHTAPCDES
ncbi:uncharacterized protein [Diadema setosum]|uniref:uncharacterized protein n=1 Tax=Diadema setosum TaxID=31175 RepID=UPI003B3A6BDA